MKMPRFALAVAALAVAFAGCSGGETSQESATTALQSDPETYTFDGSLRARVGREVRVTGYVRFEGKGLPHLDKDLSGERGLALSGAEAHVNRYVEVVGKVGQMPPPAAKKPLGTGEQTLGAGSLYILVREIKELSQPGD